MVGINTDDFGGNDLADPHFFARKTFFEQRGKTFARAGSGYSIHYLQFRNSKKTRYFNGVWLINATSLAAHGTRVAAT